MASRATVKDLCLDANDHQHIADWWCEVLGYERLKEEERCFAP
jgi:hypothetical protein